MRSKGVVHHLPMRTRLRVPKQYRSVQELDNAADALRTTPGVNGVDLDYGTGSILIHHDEEAGILAAIEKTLTDSSGDILESLVADDADVETGGLATVGHFVKDMVTAANGHLSSATSHALDLKSVVPLLFMAAGVLRWRRGGAEDAFMSISPIVLFWYAFELYWRFANEKAAQGEPVVQNRKRIAARS